MLLRLYDDDSPIEDSSKDRHQKYIAADSPPGMDSPEPTDRREELQEVPDDQLIAELADKGTEKTADKVENPVEDVDMGNTIT